MNSGSFAGLIGSLIGAVVAGVIIGLIPLLLGKKWGKERLGMVGFFVCILCNFILGLFLSIPACLVFVIVLLISRK